MDKHGWVGNAAAGPGAAVILASRQYPQGGDARWIVRIRIYRIMGIYRIVTMRCIVFTLTLALSHQGRGGNAVGVGLLSAVRRPVDTALKPV